MNWAPDRFSLLLSMALLRFAWVGAVIAVAAFLGNQLLKQSRAATRYVLNLVFLIAIFLSLPACVAWQARSAREPAASPVLPAAALLPKAELAASPPSGNPERGPRPASDVSEAGPGVERLSPTRTVFAPASVGERPQPAFEQIGERLAPWIAGLYCAGVLAMLVRLVSAVYGGHRLNRAARRIAEPGVLEVVARQARALGLRVAPAVAFCERIAAPAVVGIVRPTILVPLSVLRALTPEQLRDILTHELAHIRRCDHFVVVLQRLVEAVGHFHPGVWYLSGRLSRERELCCDDLVIAAGAERLSYANSLCRVAELTAPPLSKGKFAGLLAADGRKPSHLRQRIIRLLETPAEPTVRLTRSGALGFVALAAVVFVLPLVATALNPQRQAVIASDEGERVNSAASRSRVESPPSVERKQVSKRQDGPVNDPTAGIKVDDKKMVQFNFQDASWRFVLEEIARVSKMSWDWQTLPSDRLSLRSTGQHTLVQARDILNERLMSRGYSMLVDSKRETITVVNLDDMNTALVPRVAPEDLDNKELLPHSLVRVSFHLHWIVAEKAAAEFKPLLSPRGKLIALKTTNRLEAIDSVENVRQLARALEEADKGPPGGGPVHEFELRYARASEVLEQIQAFLKLEKDPLSGPHALREKRSDVAAGRQQSGKPGDDPNRVLRLMANPRRNSILAVGSEDQVALVRAAIKKLDVTQNSLKDAVAKFNREDVHKPYHLTNELERLEAGGFLRGPNLSKDRYPAPLTEEEVIKAISTAGSEKGAAPKTAPPKIAAGQASIVRRNQILQDIAKSRTLPPGARLDLYEYWRETPSGRTGAAEQQHDSAPGVRVKHLHWSIRLFVMTGETACEGFVIRDQELDVARLALSADPGFEWTFGPFTLNSLPYSSFDGRTIVFAEQGLDQDLSITVSLGRRDLVPKMDADLGDVRAVAFDKDGRRLALKAKPLGITEDVIMQRFSLEPRDSSQVHFLGIELLTERVRKPRRFNPSFE